MQHVYTGMSVEKMEGDYSAGNNGQFRIDYSYPEKQIVINNKKGLYWYFPEKHIVYILKKNENGAQVPAFLSVNFPGEIFKNIRIRYEGVRLFPLFNFTHVYSFETDNGKRTVKVWIDGSGKFIRKKYVIDQDGVEVIKEVYHEHINTGDVYIPSKIELFIRGAGGVIRTVTEYSNITVNHEIDNKLFELTLPENVSVRKFNEI